MKRQLDIEIPKVSVHENKKLVQLMKKCNLDKIPIMVDMVRYGEVFGVTFEISRRLDYAHNYERMDLTPDEIKDFIDKGY